MKMNELAEKIHATNVDKGFYENVDMALFSEQGSKLALVHSEVTEVLEAIRKDQGEQAVVDEISDILIRVLDFYEAIRLAGVVSVSLDESLHDKMEFNKTRPYKHGHKKG